MTTRTAAILTAGILVTAVAACWLIWQALPGGEGGPLRIEPRQIDLGTIWLKDPRHFEAEVRNVSAEEVEVAAVSAGCSCTRVAIGSRTLGPGDTTTLTGTLLGTARPGPFEYLLTVETARPSQHAYLLRMVGNAKRRIDFSPDAVVLRPDFPSDAPDTREVSVYNGSGEEILLGVQNWLLPPGVEALREQSLLAPGQTFRITILARPSVVRGQEATLRLTSSHAVESVVEIPVSIRPAAPVAVSPDSIALGVASTGELGQRRIALSLEGELLALSDVEKIDVPGFLATLPYEKADGPRREFTFSLNRAGVRSAHLSGEIVMLLRHRPSGRGFSISVPVSGFATDAVPSDGAVEKPSLK